MSGVVKILLGAMAAVVLTAVLIVFQFNRFLSSPVTVPEAGAELVIPPGVAFRQVSNELSDRGIISNSTWFRLYARLSGKAASIHAGEYLIEAGTTPAGLIDKFVSGDVQLYSFTIVEGWTFRELLSALAADEVVVPTLTYEDWPALLESIGASESHPEGLFLPETYRFPKGTSDADILRQSYRLMTDVLAEEWDARGNNLPIMSPYEALVLASIVEKETALASERPRIAGVFVRRLLAGMRLQTDPTVIYGIGPEFDGNLTRRNLRTDTPYNTYTRGGLPPTPIALPGRAAINAALNPADGTELYFVATGLGDGSHKFSDTKDQHDQAVREYLARQRASRAEAE
ncbi:MAG: endolytic transglycosylase MltG [Gammaproteobacteria bacterium]|nr:endolytic transglycosylase MltG [Gammaproteobacteria bacterium]